MVIRKFLAAISALSTASFVNAEIYEWRDYDGDGNEHSWLSDSVVTSGVDLSDQWLVGAEMRGYGSLEGLDLSYAKLNGSVWSIVGSTETGPITTSFEWSDATYTRFIRAHMRNGEYNNNNFAHANFDRAMLRSVDMKNSNFYLANLTNIYGEGIRDANSSWFSGSNFTLAHFDYSEFEGSRFDGATFNGADFLSANFSNALFVDADLSGSINWETANWTGAKYNDYTIFAAGMDPNALGMVHVPAPSVLALLGVTGLCGSRRRRE